MKKKIFNLGFVIIIMAIFTLANCNLFPTVEFPTEFRGTWIREDSVYTNTLTITLDTYKLSNQSFTWELIEISNGAFRYILKSNPYNWAGRENIKFEDGKLIIDPCGDVGISNCGGTWIKY